MTQTFAETAHGYLADRKMTPISAVALRLVVTFIRWQEWNRSRRALQNMSDWQLKDIGVSRETAEHEATRGYFET